ncbi:DET1- and DDB1-associated 1 [Brachionus plicatilis]|uniref:DET1-and DDB1-associated 1 n=1 Tax=Brachionus plicatilis TaxID=10195 RepID=A0A3M7PWF1_BRAPC|nr:DET1- and DDB1-associated 1 [Brachionus plicatilis]
MALYLKNLPSFNKENFSNFQHECSQICASKKSFLSCSSSSYDYSTEQIIVNSSCNIIIQYLEKQVYEKTSPERARKREIAGVMKTDTDELTKLQKRRKLIQNSVDYLDDSYSSVLDGSTD